MPYRANALFIVCVGSLNRRSAGVKDSVTIFEAAERLIKIMRVTRRYSWHTDWVFVGQSNTLTHRSITVESTLTSVFLKWNFLLQGASCGSAPAIERKVCGTVSRIDVDWHRPRKNDGEPLRSPDARVSLRSSIARGKSQATSGRVPTGRTSSRQTDPNS